MNFRDYIEENGIEAANELDFEKFVHQGVFEKKAECTIPLSVINEIKSKINNLPDLNPDYPMDKTTHISKWGVLDIIDECVQRYQNTISKRSMYR